MKCGHAICLASLLSLYLLPPVKGEEPMPPGQSEQQAEQPEHVHPIFDHWHEVLMAQSEPEQLFAYHLEEGKKLSEENLKQAEETRQLIANAMEAAQMLFEARMDIICNSLFIPDSPYLDEIHTHKLSQQGKALLATCEHWVAEGFRRDLEALSFGISWLDAGCVEPSLRPGRQELLLRPALETTILEQGDEGFTSNNERWQQRQQLFMKNLFARYGQGELDSYNHESRDPFTGMPWNQDQDSAMALRLLRYRARMQELIRNEQEAWEIYDEAMSELVCPYYGYFGSGHDTFKAMYQSNLLDSRERFLLLLTVGCRNLHTLNDLAIDHQAELQELHTDYRFGEIFTAHAHLFRHPRLEGKPWCIRFKGMGAGFIFIKDNEVLQHYATTHPQGGDISVRGYQSIEPVGAPYEPPRPEGGFKLRQVFHMIACPAPEKE